jgi:hypothetical protein
MKFNPIALFRIHPTPRSKMKYVLIACLFFVSCVPKMIALKGTYPTPPMRTTTSANYDSVWNNLIDYIALTGGYTRVIDKASGILVSEDYSFTDQTTTEDKKGRTVDPRAFLVSSKYKTANTMIKPGPMKVTGNWNVRLKPSSNGTLISVNITNLKAFDYFSFRGMGGWTEKAYEVKSTGLFEKRLIDVIK